MDAKLIVFLAIIAMFSIETICQCIVKSYRAKHGVKDDDFWF